MAYHEPVDLGLDAGVENVMHPRRPFRPQTPDMNERSPIEIFLAKEQQDPFYLYKFDNLLELIDIVYNHPNFMATNYGDVSDRRLEFIDDCLHYLLNGRRRVCLEQWLVMDQNDTGYLTPKQRHELELQVIDKKRQLYGTPHDRRSRNSDFQTHISMWCKQPGGVRDLAYSTYFFSL